MILKPQITIRDFPQSPALESHILNKINKLNQYCHGIMHCDVVLRQEQKHKHQGKLYKTRIDITVPGQELTVNRASNEDVYVAIRDAFRAACRRLKAFARRQRRQVKSHPVPLHGRITRLFRKEGFGFIECNDNEYYFAQENVSHPSFETLREGSYVQFIEVPAAQGMQAHRVTNGKHHHS